MPDSVGGGSNTGSETRTCRVLTDDERAFIAALASSSDGHGKHAAFLYGLLREPLLDVTFMAHALADVPLTREAMTYIAEHWRCSCYPSYPLEAS